MRYIDTKSFLRELDSNKKYCFILGSGASVSSGIPTGQQLAEIWLEEIRESGRRLNFSIEDEIERRTNVIRNNTNNSDVEKIYTKFKDSSYTPDISSSLEDYNRICELRFMGNRNEERESLYELMKEKVPYVGYWALANVLTRTDSRFVITTNFDELTETAIRDYTSSDLVVISHESVGKDIPIELMNDRPRILKIHRDITTGPFNTSEATSDLKTGWEQSLSEIFKTHIPIVIGYAGTDMSLSRFLLYKAQGDEIFWCHMYGELPNSTVVKIVDKWNGKMVEIWEFDHIMLHIASILCKDTFFQRHIIGETLGIDNYQGYTGYYYKGPIRSLKRNDKPKDVIKLYKEKLKCSPTPISYKAVLMTGRGTRLNAIGKHDRALVKFDKAFHYEMNKYNRYYGKAKYFYGKTQFLLKKYDEAATVLEELLDAKDLVADAGRKFIQNNTTICYAMTLVRARKYKEAQEVVDGLLEHRRCDSEIYRVKAITDYALEKYTSAISVINMAIECDQYNTEGLVRDYLDRGILNLKLCQTDESISDFKRSLSYGYCYNTVLLIKSQKYQHEELLDMMLE